MKENRTPIQETTPVRNANHQELKTFLTSHELARYLRVSMSTIRNRVKEGSIPFTKVYGKLLFDLIEINAWVAEQRELDRMVKRATVNKTNQRSRHQTSELPVVFTLD